MSQLIRQIEKVFVVFSLVFFSNAISPVVNQARGLPPNENALIVQVISLGIRAGIILLIAACWKKVIRVAIREKFLWTVVGIALVSVCWSAAPEETLRTSIVLLFSTLFGVYLAARYSLNEQLRLLAWALGVGALLSLICVMALPSYGVMGMGDALNSQEVVHAGAWKGVYGHKNALGRLMSLGAIVFFFLIRSSRKFRWVAWTGLCLCVALLLLSTSKTALIVFLTIMALMLPLRALRLNYSFAVPFLISVILVFAGVAIFNAEAILGTFGGDTTLTGRTLLWAAVLYKIWQRPWLGYGYGGFWRGWEGESADVWRTVNWEVPHAHNGLLDLWLDLGLLGLTVFIVSYIVIFLRAVSLIRQTKLIESFWPLVYLIFFLLSNLTESSLVKPGLSWILYVTLIFSMHSRSSNLAEANTFRQQKIKGICTKDA